MTYFYVITVAAPVVGGGERRNTLTGIWATDQQTRHAVFNEIYEFAKQQLQVDSLNVMFYQCEPNQFAPSDALTVA
ncbi:hypothetical protein OHA25_04890 [Nonomuraea sp. NBC_00507]|uniref:hypothetical protein n=1 Tax=Nonomuraea sp. NBC_00507 TaxID=2976002 RepID=UPI002E19C589